MKQDYGNGHFSLLCEEFIRTYINIFRKGNKPQTYEDFVQKISKANEKEFQKELDDSKDFVGRCKQIGIKTLDDFKNKSREYFERFEKNPLRDLMFEFYQEYSNRPDKDTKNFEQFVLSTFPSRI